MCEGYEGREAREGQSKENRTKPSRFRARSSLSFDSGGIVGIFNRTRSIECIPSRLKGQSQPRPHGGGKEEMREETAHLLYGENSIPSRILAGRSGLAMKDRPN